jgi:hypothetical protein
MAIRRLPAFSALIVLMILVLSLFCSTAAHASIGFQSASPEELKMIDEPHAPGAAAVILFRQVDRDESGMQSHEENYYRIKILTEEGRKYADVEIPFFKGGGNVVNIRARTTKPDGSIVNFDGKIFDKTIAKARGFKYEARTFTLPDVAVGSVIEYSYSVIAPEYGSHWILSNELFTRTARFSFKPLGPSRIPLTLRWQWSWLPPGTPRPAMGPDRIVRLEASNIPAFETEDFMPPENELKSRVDFIYTQDAVQHDADKFWEKVGKATNESVERFIDKRKAMEQAVGQIVSPNDSQEMKLQKIYARVQQLRNTSYEIQKSTQEEKRAKEKQANNVEDIWKHGYGDGEEITWLYLALVRSAGFEAYGVVISERRNYFFNPKMMDTSRLDTNVVLVKLNGKDVYFDPGALYTPFGMLPWSETSVPGLRLDKDGGSWITTTLPASSLSRIDRKSDLKVSQDSSDLEGKLTVTYTGLEASRRRVEEHHEDDADRKKMLEDEVREFIPASIEVDLANQPDWNSSSPTLVAEFNLKVPGWISAAGRRELFPAGLFGAAEKHVFDHSNRVHPIYFEFPCQRVDDLTIEIPSGWQVYSLPKPQHQNGNVVNFSTTAEDAKGKLHLTRSLSLDLVLVGIEYYPSLRSFFQTVRTDDEQQIVLQPGTATASN